MGLCASAGQSGEEKGRSVHLEPQVADIWIGTWNVGNAPPPDDLGPWIPKVRNLDITCTSHTPPQNEYELYVIGTQECKYDAPKGKNTHQHFIGLVEEHLGPNYQCIKSDNLMEMRIAVFAESKLVDRITDVHSASEATGVAGVVGNKGGVAVGLKILDTSFCFVNTHLAAHQDKTLKRNEDVAEVIGGLKLANKTEVQGDILTYYNHVIWMGDLNYRLAFGDDPEARTPSEQTFGMMVAMVEADKFPELFKHDQANNVFIGFREGEYKFAPTFKVERGHKLKYKPQRSPAWCDRVLWRSMPGCKIKQTGLGSSQDILTSDHKPVWSSFEVEYWDMPAPKIRGIGDVKITITNLKGKGLLAADVRGTSDPFIKFWSPVLEAKGHIVQTERIDKTCDPEWTDDQVPALELASNNLHHIRLSSLVITAWDHDVASGDDLLGTAVLHLDQFCPASSVAEPVQKHFCVDLTKGGRPNSKTDKYGTLEGDLLLQWKPQLQ